MVKRIKIMKRNILLVFRHRFEKEERDNWFLSEFREWEIGFWFRKDKIVGTRNFNKPKEWRGNLCNSYRFGINALIFKVWVEYDKGGMHIAI